MRWISMALWILMTLWILSVESRMRIHYRALDNIADQLLMQNDINAELFKRFEQRPEYE